MRASRLFLLIPILCAVSCARASRLQGEDGVSSERVIKLDDLMSMRVGPVLTALPPDQRYRFVSPDSLATGISAADASSIWEPRQAELRKVFSTVVASGRWVESDDSAQFDVTIFSTSRMTMRRAQRIMREQPNCGQYATTALQWCIDEPAEYVEAWGTEYYTFHIIRRRSDGAARIWRRHGAGRVSPGAVRTGVSAELLEMLRAGEQR